MSMRGRQAQRAGLPQLARSVARLRSHAEHPVLALQRAAGNRAVAAVVARRVAGTAKAQALARLKNGFGITVVREGTIAEQAQRADGVPRYLSVDEAQKQLAASGWAAWSPPEKSGDWSAPADGVARFAATMGGLPAVREIMFFAQDYDYSAADRRLVPAPDVGASFATGSLLVFEKSTRGRFLASARRTPDGQSATTREGLEYETTHELGHGHVEKAMAADPAVVTRYAAAVGWVGGRLYDIGLPAVREALSANRTPPEAARLTAKNWEKADVVEQPMTEYMVSSPAEDFPEAVAAFVNRPDILKARSPRRFAFVQQHVAAWRASMRTGR
jgi:hypothetical protein